MPKFWEGCVLAHPGSGFMALIWLYDEFSLVWYEGTWECLGLAVSVEMWKDLLRVTGVKLVG